MTFPFTPADQWEFGGVDLQQDTLRIRLIQGYANVPAVVGGGIKLVSTHGERFFKRLHGARKMSFTIDLFAREDDELIDIHRNLDLLATVFGVTHKELQLIHHHPDGTDRSAYGICIAWNPADASEIGQVYVGVADILLSDPYFYRPDIDSGVMAPPPGAAYLADIYYYTVRHPGTVRGSHNIITLTGPSSRATIDIYNTSITPNPMIQLNLAGGMLGAGEQVVINTKTFTVTRAGVPIPGQLVHGANPLFSIPTYYEFMLLDPGANIMRVDGMSGGTIQHIFSPPYL